MNLTIAVPAGYSHFAAIYEPRKPFPAADTLPQYSIWVPAESVPGDLHTQLYVKNSSIKAYTRRRPPVVAPTTWLIQKLQELDAHNRPRDQLFLTHQLRVIAALIELPPHFQDRGWGTHSLQLIEVEIVDHD